jgi:hypothetical protein
MDVSLQSLLFFIIITIGYFIVIKPTLTLQQLAPDCYQEYKNSIFPKLALYLLIVCFVQFLLNTAYLTGKCGGEVKNNIGTAALYTLFPWLIIFGIMIAALIIFPGFKSAFSDVIGYFVIAGGATELFANIMENTDINEKIVATPDPTKQAELRSAADAIIKLLGNKSILINQITPDNFTEFWKMLKPLMKDTVVGPVEIESQEKLLSMVVLKDNIGEAFWYVYTAILISSIVYYNLANRGCVKSVEQIKAGYDEYLKEQADNNKKAAENSTSAVLN